MALENGPLTSSETPEQIARRLRPGKLAAQFAVVTGAGSGIGKAISIDFAREDAAGVALVGRNKQNLEETAHQVEAWGARALVVVADVRNPEDWDRIIGTPVKEFGQINQLTNNAGVTARDDKAFNHLTVEDWRRVIDTNLMAPTFLSVKAFEAFPGRREKDGNIVNISSILGQNGNGGAEFYAASKAGLIAVTLSHAQSMGRRKVRVNAVTPGWTKSAMTENHHQDDDQRVKDHARVEDIITTLVPSGRLGEPEDVAKVVSVLASRQSGYLTGEIWGVAGGLDSSLHAVPHMLPDRRRIDGLSGQLTTARETIQRLEAQVAAYEQGQPK